jgi:predicted HicB family RNase H-like nuclease
MLNLSYKGYNASYEIDESTNILVGRVLDLNDSILFEGLTPADLIQSFEEAVDDYLAYCSKIKKSPEKPFSGKISYRTDPDTHRIIFLAAKCAGDSINSWMDKTLKCAAIEKSYKSSMHAKV